MESVSSADPSAPARPAEAHFQKGFLQFRVLGEKTRSHKIPRDLLMCKSIILVNCVAYYFFASLCEAPIFSGADHFERLKQDPQIG